MRENLKLALAALLALLLALAAVGCPQKKAAPPQSATDAKPECWWV